MKIIAATDFSPTATNAARSAVRLARKLGDSVLLVRVIEPPVAVYPELRVPDAGVFEAALRQENEKLMEKAAASLREEGVVVEAQVRTGSPAQELAALAQDQSARLIVMGTRGHGVLASLLVGSVAERTVLAAPCPVLLVPEKQALFESWNADRPLRLLVGFVLDATSHSVLASLDQLGRAGPCQVTLVHTYWPPGEYARLGLSGPKDLLGTDPEIAAVLEREIRTRLALRGVAADATLRIEAAWGPVSDTLALTAAEDQADLLVVGTRQPHAWQRLKNGSTSIGTLRQAPTALLCVPARPAATPARTAIAPLRTVLVPTDFSDLANAAIPYAYSLLRGTAGTVELCHVHEHHLAVPAYVLEPQNRLSAAEKTGLEARLRALVPPESEALGISTRVTVVDGGSAAEAILQTAERLGADAITVASHGRSGLARTVMGSVAEAILRGSSKPVFVVRPDGR
jgi:nucleotide-binding universal stress UspA family protein